MIPNQKNNIAIMWTFMSKMDYIISLIMFRSDKPLRTCGGFEVIEVIEVIEVFEVFEVFEVIES